MSFKKIEKNTFINTRFDAQAQNANQKMNSIQNEKKISGDPSNKLMKILFSKNGVMKILENCDDGDNDFKKRTKKVTQKRKSVVSPDKSNFFYRIFSNKKNIKAQNFVDKTWLNALSQKYQKEVLEKVNQEFEKKLKKYSGLNKYTEKQAEKFEQQISNFDYTEDENKIKKLVYSDKGRDANGSYYYIYLNSGGDVKTPQALVKAYCESSDYLVNETNKFIENKLKEYEAINEKAAKKVRKATANYSSFVKLFKNEFSSYCKIIAKREKKGPLTELDKAKKRFAEICGGLTYSAPTKEEIENFASIARKEAKSEIISKIKSFATLKPNKQAINIGLFSPADIQQLEWLNTKIQILKNAIDFSRDNIDSGFTNSIALEAEGFSNALETSVNNGVIRQTSRLNELQSKTEELKQQAENFSEFNSASQSTQRKSLLAKLKRNAESVVKLFQDTVNGEK